MLCRSTLSRTRTPQLNGWISWFSDRYEKYRIFRWNSLERVVFGIFLFEFAYFRLRMAKKCARSRPTSNYPLATSELVVFYERMHIHTLHNLHQRSARAPCPRQTKPEQTTQRRTRPNGKTTHKKTKRSLSCVCVCVARSDRQQKRWRHTAQIQAHTPRQMTER